MLYEIPLVWYHILSGSVFLAGVLQLLLCIYLAQDKPPLKCLPDSALFLLIFSAAVFLGSNTASGTHRFLLRVPWWLVPAVSLLCALYALVRLFFVRKALKSKITAGSIKEALDNLGTAILFADERGIAVLTNHKMVSFCVAVSGGYPHSLQQLEQALASTRCIDKKAQLYQTKDGSVWHYRKSALSGRKLVGFQQLTVQDVTELYEANALLEKENEALRATNLEFSQMLERLAERIREQEILALKTQIHNDIGLSLMTLSNLVKRGNSSDVEEQIDVLQNAVGYFANNRVSTAEETLEREVEKARSLGVTLCVQGDYRDCESLVAAAAKECVSNCVNHAKGDRVEIVITPQDSGKCITITNNGKPPAGEIRESGGLASLRKKVQKAGAVMRISHTPHFVLTIIMGE